METAMTIDLTVGLADKNYLEKEKKCPVEGCRTTADCVELVEELFGYRWSNGHKRSQSWCKICRRVSASAKPPETVKSAPRFYEMPPAAKVMLGLKPTPPMVVITSNKESVREIYKNTFPKDSSANTRAMKFMVQKLIKRLPDAIVEPKVKEMFSL